MNACLLDRAGTTRPAAARGPRLEARHLGARHNCLWVCRISDRVVGMIGLRNAGPGMAQLRLFQVDPEWCHTSVPKKLIQCVHGQCRRAGLARMVMDARVAPPWFLQSLCRHGFWFEGCRTDLGRRVLEFRVEHGARRLA